MPKKKAPKKKLTAAQKAEKKRRKAEWQTIFIRGKQVRVRRPEMIDGVPVEEFIENNACDIWLMEHGYYALLDARYAADNSGSYMDDDAANAAQADAWAREAHVACDDYAWRAHSNDYPDLDARDLRLLDRVVWLKEDIG
jgi:hypothetical protein